MAANIDVIVLDENKLVAELPVAHQLRDLLKDAFSGLVMRMRLAGKHKLHRAFRVVHHGRQSFEIAQNQISPLVSRKAAREANGERIRTEYAFEPLQFSLRFVPALRLLDRPSAHEFQKSRLQVEMRLPKFAVIHVLDSFPDLGLAAALVPSGTEMAV